MSTYLMQSHPRFKEKKVKISVEYKIIVAKMCLKYLSPLHLADQVSYFTAKNRLCTFQYL